MTLALFWIVPAKVEGTWQTGQASLTLKQQFQTISGTLGSGSRQTPITEGKLRGDQITFMAGAAKYEGRVNGNRMEGTLVSGGRSSSWDATRSGR